MSQHPDYVTVPKAELRTVLNLVDELLAAIRDEGMFWTVYQSDQNAVDTLKQELGM